METENFDADAAFDEAVNAIETGGQTASSQPSAAEPNIQNTPDQQKADTQTPDDEQQTSTEGTDELPEWLATATDEVKDNFRKLQAENKQLAHRERSQRGRVGALSKKWQQAQAALEQAKQSQGNYDQELASLKEDYPELASLLTRVIAEQNSRLNAISSPMAQVAEANLNDMAASEMDSAIDYVSQIVPDAMQIAGDPQFQMWVSKQPKGVQALFSSNDPNDAIYLLSEYKKVVSAQKEQRTKRQQQLSAMSLPTGRNTPKGGDDIDENALFDSIAADLDRQLAKR